ncbi:hypothetical protein [Hymenobacter sp. AT01-02]|uniref:hypothetical protein n=1 Tax=Hymenobacter sp. AT01-02 TaxID=1571877 RepID=UPI000B2BFCF8|nr:hypothetical protein [Hymenobacter sp. AT01-02]
MSLLTAFLVLVTCSSFQQQTDIPPQAPDTSIVYTKRRIVLPEVPQRGRILDRHDSVLVATRPQYLLKLPRRPPLDTLALGQLLGWGHYHPQAHCRCPAVRGSPCGVPGTAAPHRSRSGTGTPQKP